MIVYIPIAEGMTIPPEVTAALAAQTVPVDIVIKTNVRPYGNRTDLTFKYRRANAIAMNRQSCIDDAISKNLSHACICNYDILHLLKTNLADAVAFLEGNPSWGAVTFTPTVKSNHMMDSSVVIRGAAMPRIDYGKTMNQSCACYRIQSSLEKAGLKYGYLDALPRIRDLEYHFGK